jgi:replicative superfamily II helicase
MADRVIVVGVRRGHERITASEISQMVGRAGRKHGGGICQTHILAEDDDYDDVVFEMSDKDSFKVESKFDSLDGLVFHILPDICNGLVRNPDEAKEWYRRSFASFQGKKVNFDKVFSYLEKTGAIKKDSDGFAATVVGDVATKLYFHPADVGAWRDNFSTLFGMGMECDDLAVAWALGNVPIHRVSGDLGKQWHIVSECKGNMPPGLDMDDGTSVTISLWWCALCGPSVGKMRNQMLSLRDDFGRIENALISLDKRETKWGMTDFFEDLEARMRRGIPSVLSELCKLPKISKNRAAYLYNMGVRDVAGIREIVGSIGDEVDEDFLQALRNIASESVAKSSRSL